VGHQKGGEGTTKKDFESAHRGMFLKWRNTMFGEKSSFKGAV
jgi:hypothetical protein